jgi:Lsr2
MPRGSDGQVTDDYDGEPLPQETPEIHLGLGSTTYHLYLSEENHQKLLEVLEPFIGGADDAGPPGRMHNMR